MNYNLSRIPGTYECDREHFGFDINRKIYNAREYKSGFNNFVIMNNKKLGKYIDAADIYYNPEEHKSLPVKKFDSAVKTLFDTPLYIDSTVHLYCQNQAYVPVVTKLVLRKLIIGFLAKQDNVTKIDNLTDERLFKTTFIIDDIETIKAVYTYLFNLRWEKYETYEDFLNSNVKKIGKSLYLMKSTDKYKIDPSMPIKFTNVADELDCADVYVSYLNVITRIRNIWQHIDAEEKKKNKKFKSSVIWVI